MALIETLMVNDPGTLYTPGDTVVLAGGIAAAPSQIFIHTTQVVAISVVSPGSGGTTGNAMIVGTTGSGTPFAAAVTIVGGAISGTPKLISPGSYSVNPTTLAAEPVTGGGLSGAVVAITMGALTALVGQYSDYQEVPNAPVAQSVSTGIGTGATWDIKWLGMTPNLFRRALPGFADTVNYPTVGIEFWLDLARKLLPGNRLGNMYDYATTLFVAHNMSIERMNTATGENGGPAGISRGAISSESGNGLSASYDVANGVPEKAGHWSLTNYGTRFLDLVRRRGVGPIQIGIGHSPAYLTGAGWVDQTATGAWAGPPTWVPSWFAT